ncbi:hypothetical protein HanRHA438_Chr12g0571011 [Helianthus annuus]|uniref:Uncharacterized protein n=1 Tax=Helianthus annuus TaxID=4232 RepID=A0A251RUS9_HELAN|nr:hypothetical protein HanXRQr2_Chr12g0559751 [Helianthus annuus]KAJ0868118.1 hypothetical protein HanRHA438_Chr12g0571011 [Helianthus annuus]
MTLVKAIRTEFLHSCPDTLTTHFETTTPSLTYHHSHTTCTTGVRRRKLVVVRSYVGLESEKSNRRWSLKTFAGDWSPPEISPEQTIFIGGDNRKPASFVRVIALVCSFGIINLTHALLQENATQPIFEWSKIAMAKVNLFVRRAAKEKSPDNGGVKEEGSAWWTGSVQSMWAGAGNSEPYSAG